MSNAYLYPTATPQAWERALPCPYCGSLIPIPDRFARAKRAYHPDCKIAAEWWVEEEKRDPLFPSPTVKD